MQPGDKVRLIANPGRIGIIGNETDGPPHRQRVLVNFLDGDEQFILMGSLEKVERGPQGPYELIRNNRFGRAPDLRGAITHYRLSGRLANLIYSLNTTNTRFLAYQFKPVLQFLDSPSNGLLIADEVGLGKTIEAGLIWTELRAREDARRLLVVCPAMLCEKWKRELDNKFGVQAEITDAAGLLDSLKTAKSKPQASFALIVSQQGVRPPRGWNDDEDPSMRASAKLARFMQGEEIEEPLLDLTIIDEAHYLRNRETQTHRFGNLLRPVTQSMIMLSATPVQLNNTDLFNLVHLLDEDAFPFEFSFDVSLKSNAPIVRLRDAVLNGVVSSEEFTATIEEALRNPFFDESSQLAYLLENPPRDDDLADPEFRSEMADRLDRVNPLSKVVTRTLKRDVQEGRVERLPRVIKAAMSQVEEDFYSRVTQSVRSFCEDLRISEGFMLTIPQRQMASCMAAACRGWQERLGAGAAAEQDELLYELDADESGSNEAGLGSLLGQLVRIAKSVGDYQALRDNDSKYQILLKNLVSYWDRHPGKKVVLFSFYRNTLYYLAERLKQAGIDSVIVHGGIDKDEALRRFESQEGANILLSTEVAAEGVDLQFSSLLVNYDLPWNPAKIEQRIGRIDRIGQEEQQILIWNLLYESTVDERVHDRLLDRLDIFRNALGSMEAVLGEEIRELTYELMSHQLSPEREIERIDRTQVAIATVSRQQRTLEEEATGLIAHGEFIQNKVRAANELGRYIQGEDLYNYVKDYFQRHYPGTHFYPEDGNQMLVRLELSTQARMDVEGYQTGNRLASRSAVTSLSPPLMLFENRVGKSAAGVERVTQDHPLVRFVAEKLKSAGDGPGYNPVSAVELHANVDTHVPSGVYVYVVERWTISGSRDIERLEYRVRGLDHTTILEGEQAELLVNTAALKGRDWLGAATVVDGAKAADYQNMCLEELEQAFDEYIAYHERENSDRVRQMVRALEHKIESSRRKTEHQVERHIASGDKRRVGLVKAARARFEKEQKRLRARIDELELKDRVKPQSSSVSAGVIRIV
jgi:hypothetical protein